MRISPLGLKPASFVIACLLVCSPAAAQTVVADAVEISAGSAQNPLPFSLTVKQRLDSAGVPFDSTTTSFSIDPLGGPTFQPIPGSNAPTFAQSGTLAVSSFNLDESADWYLVEPGDLLTANPQQRSSLPNLIDLSGTVDVSESQPLFVTLAPGLGGAFTGSFYLGFVTGYNYINGDFDTPVRDVFGWVELDLLTLTSGTSTLSVATVANSATAYGSGGIIVGTTTSVPEPSAFCLAGLLASGALLRRR